MPFSTSPVDALNALQNSMMLTPRCPSAGPIGGDGFAAPAGTCNLIYPVIFLATWSPFLRFSGNSGGQNDHLPHVDCYLLAAFDLLELQFDRGSPAKDRYRNLDAAAVEIQFLDDTVEAREGTV